MPERTDCFGQLVAASFGIVSGLVFLSLAQPVQCILCFQQQLPPLRVPGIFRRIKHRQTAAEVETEGQRLIRAQGRCSDNKSRTRAHGAAAYRPTVDWQRRQIRGCVRHRTLNPSKDYVDQPAVSESGLRVSAGVPAESFPGTSVGQTTTNSHRVGAFAWVEAVVRVSASIRSGTS